MRTEVYKMALARLLDDKNLRVVRDPDKWRSGDIFIVSLPEKGVYRAVLDYLECWVPFQSGKTLATMADYVDEDYFMPYAPGNSVEKTETAKLSKDAVMLALRPKTPYSPGTRILLEDGTGVYVGNHGKCCITTSEGNTFKTAVVSVGDETYIRPMRWVDALLRVFPAKNGHTLKVLEKKGNVRYLDAVGYFSKTQKRLRKQFLRGLGNSETRDFAID